jgi:ferredoxin-NADP reductase
VAEHARREVWWLHSARNRAEHAFAEEAQVLLSQLANAHAHVCYSQPAPDDRQGDMYTTAGRLSAELIEHLGVPSAAHAYLCGPAAFMAELGASLAGLGFDPSRIHTETFGALAAITPGVTVARSGRPHLPSGPPGPGPAVSFARSDVTVNWRPDYANLLELAEACNVATRWACRTGVCHTCETPILSGSVDYAPEPIDPPAEGNILICCSQPQAELVLDL